MLYFRPSLCIFLLVMVHFSWAQCLHPSLNARLLCLEKRIAENHERIAMIRTIQYKYFQELQDIKESELQQNSAKSKFEAVKFDLNSLSDLAEQRFLINYSSFKFISPDNLFSLSLHSLLEVDNDTFANYSGLTINNGIRSIPVIDQNTINRFWVNRARFVVVGTLFRYLNFYFNPDFGQSQQRIYDAFVSIHHWRSLGLKIGKQTSLASGVENFVMTSVYHTLQPGFTTILAPNREVGLVLFGSLGPYRPRNYNVWLSPFGFDDWLSYQFGFFGGTADGTNPGLNPVNIFEFSTQVASISNKAFEGRVLMNPFINYQNSFMDSLAVAFSGSSQIVNNERFMPALTSPGLNPIFVYQSTVAARGPRNRIHPTVFWHYKKFGVILDGTQTIQRISSTENANQDVLSRNEQPSVGQVNRAVQAQFTYNLTPEDYIYLTLKPERDFHFGERGAIGAWQVVFQYSRLMMDPSVFQDYTIGLNDQFASLQKNYTYSDPRISVQKATTLSFTLNWYWNKVFRISTEYDQTAYLGGCSTGGLSSPVSAGCLTAPQQYIRNVNSTVLNRPTEKLILERFQLFF